MDNTKGNILIYQNEKGDTKVDAQFLQVPDYQEVRGM